MNGLAGIVIALAAMGAAIFLLRRLQKFIIRDTLKKAGYRTLAVSALLETEQLLMAKGPEGVILVARVESIPANLAVEIKTAMMPLSHEILHWFEFTDGKRVNATPI